MKENRVKRILADGGLAIGTHVGGIADPQIVEIIGLAGFDAAFIDMEHTSFDLRDIQLMVMAAERAGVTPIVRTPGFDPAFILRLLDMGVQGIQVPHVSTADTRARRSRRCATRRRGERGMAAASRAADAARPACSTTWPPQTGRSRCLHDRGRRGHRQHRCDRRGRRRRSTGGRAFGFVALSLGISGHPDHQSFEGLIARGGAQEQQRRAAGAAARSCRLSAQRGSAQGSRRRLPIAPDPGIRLLPAAGAAAEARKLLA